VLESGESIPPRWTITIVSSPPKAPVVRSRAAPRFQNFAEDFY
jgi:hypothetical protein